LKDFLGENTQAHLKSIKEKVLIRFPPGWRC